MWWISSVGKLQMIWCNHCFHTRPENIYVVQSMTLCYTFIVYLIPYNRATTRCDIRVWLKWTHFFITWSWVQLVQINTLWSWEHWLRSPKQDFWFSKLSSVNWRTIDAIDHCYGKRLNIKQCSNIKKKTCVIHVD